MVNLTQVLDLAWDSIHLDVKIEAVDFAEVTGLIALEQALAIRVRELLFQFGLINASSQQIQASLGQLTEAVEMSDNWIEVGGVTINFVNNQLEVSAKVQGLAGPGIAATFKLLGA